MNPPELEPMATALFWAIVVNWKSKTKAIDRRVSRKSFMAALLSATPGLDVVESYSAFN
jgi:hypothetical protein